MEAEQGDFDLPTAVILSYSRNLISHLTETYEGTLIDPQYLTESTDLQRLIDGVRRAREIAQATPFDDVRGRELWPGSEARTGQELADFIRRRGQSLYRPVGTCKMGTEEFGVVDDRLRVRGIDGLRIVDASVMPEIITGHTNAATVMIAERAADWITATRPEAESFGR